MAAPAVRETTSGCGRNLLPFGFHSRGQHCVRLEPARLNQPHSSPATRTRKIVCRAGARVNGRSDFGKKVSCHSLGHKFPPRALFLLIILIFETRFGGNVARLIRECISSAFGLNIGFCTVYRGLLHKHAEEIWSKFAFRFSNCETLKKQCYVSTTWLLLLCSLAREGMLCRIAAHARGARAS